MVRASKIPFKNFEHNIKRATSLAHLDGYLEDILHNEGKRTIGAFLSFPEELMRLFGIDKLMREFEKMMKEHFKAEYKKMDKQHLENIAKDLTRHLKPKVERISEMFEDLGLLMDQTLLEQALVVAVSAFEGYLKEIVVSVVTLNKNIRKRFHQEIDRNSLLQSCRSIKKMLNVHKERLLLIE